MDMAKNAVVNLGMQIGWIEGNDHHKFPGWENVTDAMKEAQALLKEQEAVKPLREHSGGGTTWWNVCGACRTAINPNDKYCHECGRPVKWE